MGLEADFVREKCYALTGVWAFGTSLDFTPGGDTLDEKGSYHRRNRGLQVIIILDKVRDPTKIQCRPRLNFPVAELGSPRRRKYSPHDQLYYSEGSGAAPGKAD